MSSKETKKQGFILNTVSFLNEIKKKTETEYTAVDTKQMFRTHGIQPVVLSIMVDLEIVKTKRHHKRVNFHWNSQDQLTNIAERIYNKHQLMKTNKMISKRESEKFKASKVVPIAGTRREYVVNDKMESFKQRLNALHEILKDGAIQTEDTVIATLKMEDIAREKIIQILLNTVIKRPLMLMSKITETNFYTWDHENYNYSRFKQAAEQLFNLTNKNEKNMEGLHNYRTEKKKVRFEKIREFLNFISNVKEFQKIGNLREISKKMGLSSNDQATIVPMVLEKNGSMYRWNKAFTVNDELVNTIYEESLKYSNKWNKKEKSPMDKAAFGLPLGTTASAYIAEHAEKFMPTMNLRDTAEKFMPPINGTTVHPEDSTTIENVLKQLKTRLKLVEDERELLMTLLKKGEDIINIRKAEAEFFSNIKNIGINTGISPVIVPTNSYKVKHDKPVDTTTVDLDVKAVIVPRKKNKHNQSEILELFTLHNGKISKKDINNYFYPGMKFDHTGIQSLSSMLYYMCSKDIIKTDGKGNYELVKKD